MSPRGPAWRSGGKFSGAGRAGGHSSAAPHPAWAGFGLVKENVPRLEPACWAQVTAASPALSQPGLGPRGS